MKLYPSKIYKILQTEFGNLNWWPIDREYHKKNGTDPRFEIIVGAILTQNTAWTNVEKALINLKSKKMLNANKIFDVDIKDLQQMIKPSGFFIQKTERLKNMSTYLNENYNNDLNCFFNKDIHLIREELLSLNGIGPETADSIMLYAGGKPIFVVDAYTKRICERLPLDTNISYDEIQQFFEKDIGRIYSKKEIVHVYNELHAQIVMFAKNYCKKKPKCNNCPLTEHCNYKKQLLQ